VFIVSSSFSGILKTSPQERVFGEKDLLNKNSFFGRLKNKMKVLYQLLLSLLLG